MQLKNIKLFTRLTKKNELWKQQEKQKILFKELKELFIAELILKIYILSLLIAIKIDILDFVFISYIG